MKASLLLNPGYCEVLGSMGISNGAIMGAGLPADQQAYVDMNFSIPGDVAGIYVPYCTINQRANGGADRIKLVMCPEALRKSYAKVAKGTSVGAGAITDGQSGVGANGVTIATTIEFNLAQTQGIKVSNCRPIFVPRGYFLRAMIDDTTASTTGVLYMAFNYYLVNECDDIDV